MSSIQTTDFASPVVVHSADTTSNLTLADIGLQVAHRAAIVGFFAILAALGMLYVGHKDTGVTWAVAAVFVCADIGCCAALLARSVLRPSKLRREATVVLLFNATLLVLSLQLMLLTRLDLIRSVAQAFFKPE